MRNNFNLVECIFFAFVICLTSALTILNVANDSYTVDEPNHISAGLELLDQGKYTVEFQHPPVARAAIAFLPWLHDYKFVSGKDSWGAGKNTLYQGNIDEMVSKARLGTLPFLWLLLTYVYLWAKKIGGFRAASIATLLTGTSPAILAHAGLATLDLAASALVFVAIYYFYKFFEKPNLLNISLFSLFNTLAICTKFSAIPFLGSTYIATLILFALSSSEKLASFRELFRLRYFIPLTIIAFTVAWSAYGFSMISLAKNVPDFAQKFELGARKFEVLNNNRDLVLFLCNLQLPSFLVSIPAGIIHLTYHNSVGHTSYLLGEVRSTGWWYFYFVAFFFKTPILFLTLGIGSLIWGAYKSIKSTKLDILDIPIISIFAIFIFAALFSNINIGIRHLLVIYPLVSVTIALMLVDLGKVNITRKIYSFLLYAIFTVLLAIPMLRLGEYLSYFNYFAGNKPERILINSDYEWGQDYNRLAKEVANREINHIFLAMPFAGATDFNKLLSGVEVTMSNENQTVTGWVAVSDYWQAVRGLDITTCRSPEALIGKTITLYNFPLPIELSKCKLQSPSPSDIFK